MPTTKRSKSLSSGQILIVDNDLKILEALARILSQYYPDYALLRANNAELALQIARHHQPTLILTDWEMPGMSGLELLKLLKSDAACQSIPVIMCTGIMTAPADLKMALDLGAFDYLRKPLDEIELVARIRSTLRFQRQLQATQQLNESKDLLLSVMASRLSLSVQDSKQRLEQLQALIKQESLIPLVNKAQQSVGITHHQLNKLLQWAQLRFAMAQTRLCPFQLRPFVYGLCESFHQAGLAIEIQLNPQIWILCDPNLLQQVIQEILQNAREQGATHILFDCQRQQGQLLLRIQDNGPGIKPEVLKRIRSPYGPTQSYQSLPSDKTGLGLKICHEILQHLGSQLQIDSPPGEGACLSFLLNPAAR